MKYVVIGNGPAAVGTVEGIRQWDTTGEITLVSAEKHHTYSAPLLSYYLEGKTSRENLSYRPRDFYEKNGVTPLFGVKAVKLDAQGRTVTLDDGRALPYDRLCAAVGSAPFVPPMKGLETVSRVYTFMTLDEAEALGESVKEGTRVFILGAGLIGLKCAEGISGRGAHITVADLAPRVLSSILDEETEAPVRAHLEAHGLKLLLGNSAAYFEGNTAHMQNGDAVPFDILVVAVGVRPNTGLVKDAGGAADRGILVDAYGRTSLPDVYAAGDCTQPMDAVTGTARMLPLLPNAYMQGECAGARMAGGNREPLPYIAMNSIGFFGLHMVTAGSYEGETYLEKDGENFKKLFYKDNRLMGYILLGRVDQAGIYTALIRNRTDLSTIDFELVKERPTLLAFRREERMKKLGGVV